MSFKIKEINPHNSPLELIHKYIDFFDKLHLEQSPKNPLTSKENQVKNMRVKKAGENRVRLAAFSDEEEIVAAFFMLDFSDESNDYENNKNLVYVVSRFLKETNKSGVLTQLLLNGLEKIKDNKTITILETCSTFPRDWEFWRNIGAEAVLDEGRMRLYLEDVDMDLMTQWMNTGKKIASEEEIEILAFKECPNELIKEYADLYTEIFQLVPMGESAWTFSVTTPETLREKWDRRKERGIDWWVLVTKEKDGKLSGITEITYSTQNPFKITQEITGVRPKYQGRGLGKWLKAEMLFYIKKNLSNSMLIQTDNADYNKPMLYINEKMGFKRHVSEKCFKISLNELWKKI